MLAHIGLLLWFLWTERALLYRNRHRLTRIARTTNSCCAMESWTVRIVRMKTTIHAWLTTAASVNKISPDRLLKIQTNFDELRFLDYTRCGNESAQCITVASLCDGLQDCVNGWDESAESCVPLTVRSHYTECNIHSLSKTTKRLMFQFVIWLQMLDIELLWADQGTEKYSTSRGTRIPLVDVAALVAMILTRRSLYHSQPLFLAASKAFVCTFKCFVIHKILSMRWLYVLIQVNRSWSLHTSALGLYGRGVWELVFSWLWWQPLAKCRNTTLSWHILRE